MKSKIMNQIERSVQQGSYVMLSTIKSHFSNDLTSQEIVREAVKLTQQHDKYGMICLITYSQNNTVYTRYETIAGIQSTLARLKKDGTCMKSVHVDFLCVFDSGKLTFEQIIHKVERNSSEKYKKSLDNQIERNLTIIPNYAVMKDGKKYSEASESKQTVNQSKQVKPKPLAPQKSTQNIQKTKSMDSQLPKLKPLRQQAKQTKPQTQKINKKQQKKPLPNKKLRIQSDSESQDYYVPQKHPINNPSSQKMQLQNQGNYLENRSQQRIENQKMQIQEPKHQSPKDTHENDSSDDQINDLMAQMQRKKAQQNKAKESLGGKSLPPATQSKLSDISKVAPTKSVATKQGSLFGWMGKK